MAYKTYELKDTLETLRVNIEDAIDYAEDLENYEDQVEELEEKVEELEDQVEELEDQVLELEDQVEELEDTLYKMRDATNLNDIIKWWLNTLNNDNKYKIWELAYNLYCEQQEQEQIEE